jgi:hypothetical protein
MKNINSLHYRLINYTNVYILNNIDRIKFTSKKEIKKEFSIEYNDKTYIFERLHDDNSRLILYSYDGKNNDCVMLNINKKEKIINLDSFGKADKCYHGEINIGSNLLRITLKMIEQYKDELKINKIVLSDNASLPCKKSRSLNMAMMMVLLTGDTWYGKYGFRPFNSNELDKVNNEIYEINKNIMNIILLKDVNIKKYLKMIHKKYPLEFTKEMIKNILEREKKYPDKLLKTFLGNLHNPKMFDNTCHFFEVYYKKLFNDIGLKMSGHVYGKNI